MHGYRIDCRALIWKFNNSLCDGEFWVTKYLKTMAGGLWRLQNLMINRVDNFHQDLAVKKMNCTKKTEKSMIFLKHCILAVAYSTHFALDIMTRPYVMYSE